MQGVIFETFLQYLFEKMFMIYWMKTYSVHEHVKFLHPCEEVSLYLACLVFYHSTSLSTLHKHASQIHGIPPHKGPVDKMQNINMVLQTQRTINHL